MIPAAWKATTREADRSGHGHLRIYQSSKKGGLKMKLPADLDGRSIDPHVTTYSVELTTKILTRCSPSYMYFDQARAIRE
jgi:hypothetical protein